MSNKWAIKIRMGDGDWIYVTKQTEHCWDLQPELFDSKQKAIEYSKTFKKQNVKVVKYES